MKFRNLFFGSITPKKPWVQAALACPLSYLIFRFLNFHEWAEKFYLIGIIFAILGIFSLLIEKFFFKKNSYLTHMSGLFLNWYFLTFIISQITKVTK